MNRDSVLSVYSDARAEYTKQLCVFLVPAYFQFYIDLLEKAKKEKPDLIILDLMLPKMDGYKVCGLLKKDGRYSRIPVILFTARAQESDMKMGEEVCADAYVVKPFEAKALLVKIKELISAVKE